MASHAQDTEASNKRTEVIAGYNVKDTFHRIYGAAAPSGVDSIPYGEQKHNMLNQEWFSNFDLALFEDKIRVAANRQRFNSIHQFDPDYPEALKAMFGSVGPSTLVMAPFFCDFGCHIHLGTGVFINFNCTFLDCAEIHIGNGVMFGPNVQIYTVEHPLDPDERAKGPMRAYPVTIEDGCWIGGAAVIMPNVRIGKGSVIGGGSVVTKDVPPNCVYVGNPARFVKHCKSDVKEEEKA